MDSKSAIRAVNISAAVTIGSVSADSLSNGSLPAGRTLVAGLLAFAALGVVAEIAPEVGAGLAVAVGTTGFVTYGLPLILKTFPDNVKSRSGASTPTTQSKTVRI